VRKTIAAAALTALLASTATAQTPSGTMAPLRPDQTDFRGLYKELVETDTTLSAAQNGEGGCTLAAQRMAARLKVAGIPEAQLHPFADPAHPNEGGLVAIYPGSSKSLKPLLLLAHIDVVEAKRADWTRDPFTLIEENGYFFGRGTSDDKAQASIWTDTLIRFAKAGYKPKRTIKLALTCGEETTGAFNGAEYLSKNKRGLIDAAFALNEGGGGLTDGKGKLLVQTIQIGEKSYQDFTLTAINPGGHSSAPPKENAIYALSAALLRIGAYEFPLQFNDVTKAFFRKSGALRGNAVGTAMVALAANPDDKAAEATANTNKTIHSMLRTTCVATLVEAGHALNALPQRATANVNCRMFPGRTSSETMATLVQVIGDPQIAIEVRVKDRPIAIQPPLDPRMMGPVEKLAAKYFPGVPVIPAMSTGATDGVYLEAVGIPTYGVPSVWGDPDGNGTHGLNERVEAKALYTARDYLFDLVKALAN
jgi:acetylornithine deacetylase/succinyl-diaminopimelate desuccinylase-like protein